MSEREVYWLGPVHDLDDLGNPIHDEFIDGAISREAGGNGAWAMMTPEVHRSVGIGLGVGRGQHYKRQADGRWLKVAG